MNDILQFVSQYGLIIFRIQMIGLIFKHLFIEFVYNRWENSDYDRIATINCFLSIALLMLLFILSFFVPGLLLIRIALVLWNLKIIWNTFTWYSSCKNALLPMFLCITALVTTFLIH